MKLATFASCVALALLLMTPQPGAQTRGQVAQKIRADIPFDFMVQQVAFPAGSYTVRRLGNRTFHLQGGRERESFSIATEPIRTASHPGTPRLIFAEESGRYHLRELWMNSAIGVRVVGLQVEQHPVRRSR